MFSALIARAALAIVYVARPDYCVCVGGGGGACVRVCVRACVRVCHCICRVYVSVRVHDLPYLLEFREGKTYTNIARVVTTVIYLIFTICNSCNNIIFPIGYLF